MGIDLNAGKVESMVQQKCVLPLLQFCVLYTVSYEVDEIEWGLQSSWFSSQYKLTDVHLQQVTQVESTSTDLTQFELRILWIRVNLKIFHCYILLKGTGEMTLTDNSLFSF